MGNTVLFEIKIKYTFLNTFKWFQVLLYNSQNLT